jgi:hypothetical protein
VLTTSRRLRIGAKSAANGSPTRPAEDCTGNLSRHYFTSRTALDRFEQSADEDVGSVLSSSTPASALPSAAAEMRTQSEINAEAWRATLRAMD